MNKNKAVGAQLRSAVVRSVVEPNAEGTDSRQVEFVISSEEVDDWGTVFEIGGWELEPYRANPIVLYAHDVWSNDPDTIVGTSEVFIEDQFLVGRVTFEPAEINPLAEKVYQKIKAGTLRMASIHADVKEWRMGDAAAGENPDVVRFVKQVLLEWSIVPIGSNPDALKRSTENLAKLRSDKSKPETSPEKKKPSLAVRQAEIKVKLNKYRTK